MTEQEMDEVMRNFRNDWPRIRVCKSKEGRAVQQIAALYKAHQDLPTFGMLIAAHTEWKKAQRKEQTSI